MSLSKPAGKTSGRPQTGRPRRRCGLYLAIVLALVWTGTQAPHVRAKSGSDHFNLSVTASFDASGRLWRLRTDGEYLYSDYSQDLGQTFSVPVTVNPTPQDIGIGGENRASIGFDRNGVIHILYPVRAGISRVAYYSHSVAGGNSYSSPRAANRPAPAEQPATQLSLNTLAISPNGDRYHLWYARQGQRTALYVAAITADDAGGIAKKLADDLCECCAPAVAFDSDGQPVAAARFVFAGNIRDHGLLRWSADGQRNETPALKRVTFDDWSIDVCPTQGPSLAVGANGRYHLVWFTLGKHKGVFYAYSDDRGGHFSQPFAVGDPDALAMNGTVVTQDELTVLAWQEYRDGKTHMLTRVSIDNGRTWSPPSEVAATAGNADLPLLLPGPDGIYLSWNTAREGYRLITISAGSR